MFNDRWASSSALVAVRCYQLIKRWKHRYSRLAFRHWLTFVDDCQAQTPPSPRPNRLPTLRRGPESLTAARATTT